MMTLMHSRFTWIDLISNAICSLLAEGHTLYMVIRWGSLNYSLLVKVAREYNDTSSTFQRMPSCEIFAYHWGLWFFPAWVYWGCDKQFIALALKYIDIESSSYRIFEIAK